MGWYEQTDGESESVDTEYENDIKIIRVGRGEDRPLYRFEAPMYKPKDTDNTPEWENPDSARMYAAVFVAVGAFREEKTGRRGIPPEVERDGREAVVAYLSTQPGMSTEWLTDFYDLPRERIYEYRSRIKSRAEDHLIESADR